MFIIRSTSPEKSAWPGVSIMLILTPRQEKAVFLAKIVIPRSRSRGLESMMSSPTCWRSWKALSLLEEGVNEGGLAVVDVGDDGEVAEVLVECAVHAGLDPHKLEQGGEGLFVVEMPDPLDYFFGLRLGE